MSEKKSRRGHAAKRFLSLSPWTIRRQENPGIDEDCRRANLDKGGIPLLPLARTEILNDVFIEKYLVFSQLTQDHVLGLMYHHWKQP